MKLLLDSHILLWYADGDPRLTQAAIASIQDAKSLHFSTASIWELSLKMHAGKLPPRGIPALARKLGCLLVTVTPEHASEIVTLAQIHSDPFDRLLLVQAKLEELTLLTHDRILGEYGVPVLLV